ncbi:unnamed protein product [Cercospora beticola]|nr:unnamed protein product [Cercospora beticola]
MMHPQHLFAHLHRQRRASEPDNARTAPPGPIPRILSYSHACIVLHAAAPPDSACMAATIASSITVVQTSSASILIRHLQASMTCCIRCRLLPPFVNHLSPAASW